MLLRIFIKLERERKRVCLCAFMQFIRWYACGGHRKKMGHSFLISLCRLWELKSGCWTGCQASYLLSSLIYSTYFLLFYSALAWQCSVPPHCIVKIIHSSVLITNLIITFTYRLFIHRKIWHYCLKKEI